MAPSHLSPSSKPLSGRYLSFVEREEIALLRAQGHGVREIARRLARAPSTISRELRRNAATRGGGLDYRATTAQWHADRSARRPKPAKLAVNATLRGYVQDRLAGRIERAGRRGDLRATRALERPPARASPAPQVGQGVEPGADRPPAAAGLPGRRDDAHQSRGHLSGALCSGPRSAAPRADRLPAHRTGVADAASAHAREGKVLRLPRDHDQRTSRRGGRSRGPGPLGGGSDPGAGQLGHRHARRAHDAVHHPAPPAPHARPWRGRPGEERTSARRTWRRGGARRHRPLDRHSARPPPPLADLGPGSRDGAARHPEGEGRAAASSSAIRTARGSAAPTRTPTDCCASTSRRAPISAHTAPTTWRPSRRRSTRGPERPSAGAHLPKPSTRSCYTYKVPALRRPVESAQYASGAHRALLAAHGFAGSMSRRGNPYDNAKAESFMKTLKVEAVYPIAYETYEDVAADLPASSTRSTTAEATLRPRLSQPAQFEDQHTRQMVKSAA